MKMKMKGGVFDDPIILFGIIGLILVVVAILFVIFSGLGEDALAFVQKVFTFG